MCLCERLSSFWYPLTSGHLTWESTFWRQVKHLRGPKIGPRCFQLNGFDNLFFMVWLITRVVSMFWLSRLCTWLFGVANDQIPHMVLKKTGWATLLPLNCDFFVCSLEKCCHGTTNIYVLSLFPWSSMTAAQQMVWKFLSSLICPSPPSPCPCMIYGRRVMLLQSTFPNITVPSETHH